MSELATTSLGPSNISLAPAPRLDKRLLLSEDPHHWAPGFFSHSSVLLMAESYSHRTPERDSCRVMPLDTCRWLGLASPASARHQPLQPQEAAGVRMLQLTPQTAGNQHEGILYRASL